MKGYKLAKETLKFHANEITHTDYKAIMNDLKIGGTVVMDEKKDGIYRPKATYYKGATSRIIFPVEIDKEAITEEDEEGINNLQMAIDLKRMNIKVEDN